MKPYSLDLRERVVAACDQGSMTRAEVAEAFGVSVSFITKRLARRRRDTGSIAPRPHAGGFAPALGAKGLRSLAALVREQPDATPAELRVRLAARAGVSVSVPVACRWRAGGVPVACRSLRKLGLPRERSRRTPASGTRRG